MAGRRRVRGQSAADRAADRTPWPGDRPPCARRASASPARHRADNVDRVINSGQSGWAAVEAEHAFAKALRARRRASLARRFLHRCVACARLAVVDAAGARGGGSGHGVRDIPLDAIVASLEPHRAAQFDSEFRPSGPARRRWLSVWLAEERGAVLPPISVAAIGDAYAIRDGHHRVSVARARGALSITAQVA
jgi:hypothetical protein